MSLTASDHASQLPTIVVAVTFRDFTGSQNDAIQRLFLESIKAQSYPNWKLVVTLFGEKNVRREVEACGINATYRENPPVGDYRFCLTDVLLNSVEESRDLPCAVILWTTCDVIYRPDFFQTIADQYQPRLFAVSHPHVTYSSIEDLGTGRSIAGSIDSGMDLAIMDAALLRDPHYLDIITRYRFVDWGIFEHFLVGLGLLAGGPMLNLYRLSSIAKIENDRKPGNETQAWLLKCWKINEAVFRQFLEHHRLPAQLMHLTYCHLQFRVLGGGWSHFREFAGDYLRFFRSKLTRRLFPFLAQQAVRILRGGQW